MKEKSVGNILKKDISSSNISTKEKRDRSESTNSLIVINFEDKNINAKISDKEATKIINNIASIPSNPSNTTNNNSFNSNALNKESIQKIITSFHAGLTPLTTQCFNCLGNDPPLTTCENCSANYHPYCESFKGLFNIEGKKTITICNECFTAYKESNLIKKENKTLFDNCEFQIQNLSLRLKFRLPKLENSSGLPKQKASNEFSKYFLAISSKLMSDLYKNNNE